MGDALVGGGFGSFRPPAPGKAKEPLPEPPAWLDSGHKTPRIHWSDDSLRDHLRRGVPCILTGDDCPLAVSWSHAHLLAHLPAEDLFPVHFTPKRIKSVNRIYGPGLAEGGVREMTFGAYSQQQQQSTDENLYLQCLLRWARGGPTREARPLGAHLDAELDAPSRWEWLEEACGLAGSGGFEACQLWCGNGGINTPCHFDGAPNFLVQVEGRKRLLLLHPREIFHLYACPVGHPLDNYAMVDVTSPDLKRFPAAARARGTICELQSGEVLWLLPFWFHWVSQPDVGQLTLSLNYWCAPHNRPLETLEWISLRGLGAPHKVSKYLLGKIEPSSVASEIEELLCKSGENVRGATDGDDDALATLKETAAAVRVIHAARLAEVAAYVVCGSSTLGGAFLAALALEADASWPAEGRARSFAVRLREELHAALQPPEDDEPLLGVDVLLRLLTRDGRLEGLAPKAEGPIVSSERGEVSIE